MQRWTVGLRSTVLLAGVAMLLPAAAQVVREDGAGSVAGVLTDAFDDYTFQSRGGEILFADVDADVYQTQGRVEHEAHDDTGDEGGGGGCEEGGPGRLCLQILNADTEVVCWAERPVRPGWQRDPRLSCPLPATDRGPETYTLRIALAAEGEGGCGPDAAYPEPPQGMAIPYLINVTLRSIAPEGPLSRALGVSVDTL